MLLRYLCTLNIWVMSSKRIWLALNPTDTNGAWSQVWCDKNGMHTPLETWFWFQWNLTIPYDQGWWERQYEVYLKQFYCKNPDLCFLQDFKRVLWKYKISSYTTAFYLIFWFFGTFYDDQSHFCDLKVQFSTQNI